MEWLVVLNFLMFIFKFLIPISIFILVMFAIKHYDNGDIERSIFFILIAILIKV